MRVAITGARGLFGHGLVAAFAIRHEVIPLNRDEADITDREAIMAALERVRPDLIVHPAGIADLDLSDADPENAFRVNAEGTRNVVDAARRLGVGLVHVSTDAVFDGKKTTPYTESDPPGPITVYGRSKLQAEQEAKALDRCWIFRVPVLFGPGKVNFVEKGLRKLLADERYKVASDQMGCACHTVDAGMKMMEVAESGRPGLYHLANQGVCTRYELARRAAELAGLDSDKVIGVPDALMQRRVPRLKYSVLAMDALKAGGFALPRPWQESLSEYVHSLKL